MSVKREYVRVVTIELSVYDAVAHFNIVRQAASNLLTNKGIDPKPGKFCHTGTRTLQRAKGKHYEPVTSVKGTRHKKMKV